MTVEFVDLATFAQTAGGSSAVKELIDNLGDAAYYGPAVGAEPYVVAFRKGDRGVTVSSLAKDESGSRIVPNEKLREIAELIASRLQ